MTEAFHHLPVLVERVVALLAPVPPGVVVDATVGAGGHAAALLAAHPHLRLLGLDRDPEAVQAAADRLAPFGDRVTLRQARFDRLGAVMESLGIEELVGALFDLGVSSPQLDRAARGFSYRTDAPLDMRMDPGQVRTAADLVNELPVAELAELLRRYGDERWADRIARTVVAARPVETTGELVDLVRRAIPAAARRRGGHPAKRTFQALRIVVNEELDQLDAVLDQVLGRLASGGRCVVIAYHSGEDRLVKARFRSAASADCTCPPGAPCTCGAATPQFRLVRQGAWKPTAEEIAANPRAESARLRAIERVAA